MKFLKKKVLIIEDSEEDAELMREYLGNSKYYNYTLEVRDDTRSAMDALMNMDADCVVLDYRLNDDDGISLLKKLKDKKFLKAPMVFTTAYPSERVIDECLDLGVSYFLDKSKMSSETLNKAVYYAINNIYNDNFTEVRSFG